MRRLAIYVSLLLLLLPGCGAPVDPDEAQESIQVLAMDTAMLITTYGERSSAAAYACEDVIRDLEAKLSRTVEDSEVSRLNAAGGEMAEVGEDPSDFKLKYDPTDPDANEEGYVELPNVDLVKEITDAMAASQAYSADVTAFNVLKGVISAGMEIGR